MERYDKIIALVFILCIYVSEINAQNVISRIMKKVQNTEISAGKLEERWENAPPFLDSYRYVVPVTKRKYINVIPEDQLISMSTTQYKNYITNAKLSSNTNKSAQVKRVSDKLITALNKYSKELGIDQGVKDYSWEVNLVKNNEVNAFCLPGGKIVVYEGITEIASDDAFLAIVISHEIAHALAKHSAEQMTKGLISSAGLAMLITVLNSSDMGERKRLLSKLIASPGATLMNLKFSRQHETEADRIGLIITAMAGYDPETAITFWQKMEQNTSKKDEHDWYSTHPSHTNRIANIKSFLPEANSYYKVSERKIY